MAKSNARARAARAYARTHGVKYTEALRAVDQTRREMIQQHDDAPNIRVQEYFGVPGAGKTVRILHEMKQSEERNPSVVQLLLTPFPDEALGGALAGEPFPGRAFLSGSRATAELNATDVLDALPPEVQSLVTRPALEDRAGVFDRLSVAIDEVGLPKVRPGESLILATGNRPHLLGLDLMIFRKVAKAIPVGTEVHVVIDGIARADEPHLTVENDSLALSVLDNWKRLARAEGHPLRIHRAAFAPDRLSRALQKMHGPYVAMSGRQQSHEEAEEALEAMLLPRSDATLAMLAELRTGEFATRDRGVVKLVAQGDGSLCETVLVEPPLDPIQHEAEPVDREGPSGRKSWVGEGLGQRLKSVLPSPRRH